MRLLFALALAAFLFPLAAFEGPPVEIPELARRAQLIVRAKVLEKSIQRDGAGRIYTEFKLAVSEVWKGDPKSTLLKVVRGGGTFGEERDFALDEVSYNIGEDVVAFLVWNDRGQAITLMLSQGKFHIANDEATNPPKKIPLADLKQSVLEAIR
jgi:hypothetical protein